jgi:cytochrome c peroxidase
MIDGMNQPGSPLTLGQPRAHLLVWLCVPILLAAVIVADILAAQAPPVPVIATQLGATADQEPVTPVPPPPAVDPRKRALGERLFADVRLSAKGDFACLSCHNVRSNGAGGRPAKTGPAGDLPAPQPSLDALSVFNATLSFRLGWAGGFRTLGAQAEASIQNPDSMASDVATAASRLAADPDISGEFIAAYGHEPDRDNVIDALVTYERTLLTPGSRFDRWLGGDAAALSADEREGYRLFKSFGCSSCHQGVNIGGNLFQRQGVFRPLVRTGPKVVRVPSLRNVATTAPYFHDGSAATMEDAVSRMAEAQLDRTLTDQQVSLLVAFLKTLTGNYRGSAVAAAAAP